LIGGCGVWIAQPSKLESLPLERLKKIISHEPPDHALGLGRKGFSSKIHLICDGTGLPLSFLLSAGQKNDGKMAKKVIGQFLRRWNGTHPKIKKYKNPKYLAADKGYDHLPIRRWLRKKKIKDVIALISTKPDMQRSEYFSNKIYKKRGVIERCFGRMKEKRGLARRSDKLAQSYEAEVWLEIILIYLKRLGR
jgi:transposase